MSEHSEQFGAAFWDERYRSHEAVWSGDPNPQLVAELADLTPGTALDAGAGEGADAIWLASQGWQVTAVDWSRVALDRGAAQAAKLGQDIAGRITWVQEDLATWDTGGTQYALVTAQYLHPPAAQRETVVARLAGAVAPGGTLLIVGHHPSDLQTTVPRPPIPERFYTGDDIAAALDPGGWAIVTNASPARTATDPHGRTVTIHDSVLRAVRRP